MEDNVLKVRLVADTSDYEKDMKDAGEATEKFGEESKKSSTALDKLQNTIKEQQTRLKALKDEYTDLVLTQGKGDKSVKDLEAKMKLLNAQLLINEKRLQAVNAASDAFTTGLGQASNNINGTNDEVGQLYGNLQSLRGMSFGEWAVSFLSIRERMKQTKIATTQLNAEIAEFAELIKNGTQNVKELEEFLEYLNSEEGKLDFGALDDPDAIKAHAKAVKDVKDDIKSAQANLNADQIKYNELTKAGAASSEKLFGVISKGAAKAVAAIAAVVAIVVSLIGAIKNAIKTAQEIKTSLYQGSTLGLETNQYREWGYIMETVGESVDDLADAIKTLSSEQAILAEGSEGNAAAFKRLGMSVDEVLSMTQEELFTKTVKSLQKVEDQVERTALAYQIFGEDTAARLTNILYMTNEEMERLHNNFYLLGGGVTDSAIQKSTDLSYALQNMRLAWQGLTNTIAEAFMPVITAVVEWITIAIAKVNMFIRAMLGYDIVAKDTEKAENNMNGYASAMDKATKAAEKLKRTTQGFDELNIVTDPASRSAESSYIGASGFGAGALEQFNPALNKDLGLDKFAEDMERLKDIIRNVMPWALVGVGILLCFLGGPVGWITGLSLMGLGIAVGIESGAWAEQFTAVWEGIKRVWQNIKRWFVENVIPVFTKEYWKQKWANIKESVAMSPIGQAISKGWDAIAQWFSKNVKPIFTKEYWKTKWDNVKNAVAMSAIGQAISKGWDAITKWFNEKVKPIFTKEYWKQKWENIRSAVATKMDEINVKIDEKWNALKKWFAEKVAPIFTKAYWNQKWETLRSSASQKMDEIKGKLDEKWAALKKWFAEKVAPVFTAAYWTKKWEVIRQNAATAINNIGTAIFGTTGWGKIKGLWDKNIAKIFTRDFWIQKWNTAKQGAIDGVKALINGLIAKIETGINSIVRKLNGIGKIELPQWLGGGSFGGFNLKTIYIPRLATGGITTGSTLANIGENGREAILPLEHNTGWMDMLADRLASRIGGESKVVLQVGERELGWATISSINSITKQTGGLQLHLV